MPPLRRLAPWVLGAAIVALALAFPRIGTGADLFFWESVALLALFALSVNLLIGYAGIPSFGQAAFFGIGAYTVGLASTRGWSPVLVLLLAAFTAAAGAAIMGGLASRSTGIAFSMLTLAMAQALYTLTFHVPALGGENGLPGIERGRLLGINLTRQAPFWYFSLAAAALAVAALRLVVVSPFGHTLRVIRDDPKRALFLGLNVRLYRVAAFTVAGGIAGWAGALFAYANQIVTSDTLYWTQSGNPIIMALIGGVHTFWGPALGAVIFVWTTHLLAQLTPAWILYVGLVFFFFVVVMPEGLLSLPARLRHLRR